MIRIYSRSPLLPLLVLSLGFATTACGGSTKSGDQGLGSDGGEEGSVDNEGGTGDAGVEAAAEAGVVTVPLYGCDSVEYTAATTIGSQQFQLTVDTGSTTLGVASKTCTGCTGANPLYTPGSTATDEKQAASSVYGTGTWDGEVYLDGVAMGAETQFPLKFASITSQKDFFTSGVSCTSKAGNVDGIIGFGPAGAAVPDTTGYFDGLVAANHVPNVFAVELCENSGTMWLGGFDSSAFSSPPQYTPLASFTFQGQNVGSLYYLVDLETVTINGTSVGINTTTGHDAVVDTGTSAFVVPQTVFTSMTTAIDSTSAFQSVFGSTAASFLAGDQCAEVQSETQADLDAKLPGMTLTFGTSPNAITVQATATQSYLAPQDGAWCPGLAGVPNDEFEPLGAIMGQPILRNAVVIFDRANKQVGFAPHAACN